MFGEFTMYNLESDFGKLSQSFVGAYFITIQNVTENFHFEKI